MHLIHSCSLFPALALTVLLGGCHSAPSPDARKPELPIALSIHPEGELRRGETGEITVEATAMCDSRDFAIDVQLPPAVALYSGDLHRRGPVQANTRFRLSFVVRVPAQGSESMTATARLQDDAGAFEAAATYHLGDDVVASAALRDEGTVAERLGERVREFRLP